jgi:hypothetical protein
MSEIRGHEGLVEGGDARDAISEAAATIRVYSHEAVCSLAVIPAAPVLQILRKVPVV